MIAVTREHLQLDNDDSFEAVTIRGRRGGAEELGKTVKFNLVITQKNLVLEMKDGVFGRTGGGKGGGKL